MHRLIPDLIIENYRIGQHRGSFRAASMFLDISGFSVMTDALMGQGRDGAEVLAVMMGAVFDPLVEAIFGQGGMIVGYAGDSISSLFAIDTDETAAARRALASAQLIQQGLATKPVFETPYGNFHISAKIGLAFGSVSWGILASRSGDKAVYYFRGDAVEDAARAEHQAGAGDIVLTDGIREHLGADIDAELLGSFHALRRVTVNLPAARPVGLPPIDAATSAIFSPREVISGDLHGEFRQMVHMFMRIPNLADDELQHFMHTFFDVQRRYGGLIDRVDFGDKGCTLTVLWGAPAAHENDIDRALSFMLDLRSHVNFPVTAGITYYIAHAGYVGGRLYETYTSYGWGMNLAARFMMGAPENDIWLDERVYQRVRQRFHLEFVGEQAFKGFAQNQKAYVLRGRESRTEIVFPGKMVGRQSELQMLAECVAPLWEGKRAGVIGIWGEAGMGKTRLVHEFRRSPVLQGRSCMWALCQSDEILRRSFNPFRYWLSEYLEILQPGDYATRSRKFAAKLDALIAATANASLAAELKRARPFLAALVELEWPDPLYEQLDAQGRYENTIIALISILKAESLRQSVILFLDDAQYLDEESKAFVSRLKRSLATDPFSYPIAILMAARWQGAKVLLEDGLVDHEIRLNGLDDESISFMARDFLGQPADSALVTLVNRRVEGNPFFTEQILRYLKEQDLVELSAARQWSMKAAGNSEVLPADISAMLVARLDRLSGRVKEVIQAASVLGRVFDVAVLTRMLASENSLQNEIATAEQAAVWSPVSESRYVFNHALLRDVAYNMQLQSRRQELHAQAFGVLRDLFGSETHKHYAELAYHSEQAGLAAEARRCLELGGDAARDGYHNAQALDFYRRALALLPGADLRDQYRLHRECEKIVAEHGTLDERNGEVEALRQIADAMGEPGNLAEVVLLSSRLMSADGEYEKAADCARQAEVLALEAGRHDVAIGAYVSLLVAFYARGMYKEAVDHGEAGLALARKQHAPQEEAAILNWLGLAFLEMKNPSTARAYFEQSFAIFRAKDDLRGVARALTNLGSVAGYQGNYMAALDYYEQSLRLAHEIGSRNGECMRLGNLGWLSGLLGDYQKAQAYVEQALRIAREIGNRRTEVYSLINLSSHVGALGEFASAIQYAEQGLSLARQFNDRNAQAWALTYLGHGFLESGMLDSAWNAYREAIHVRHELGQPVLATEPAAGLARVALLQGDLASAQDHVNTILDQLEQDGTLEGTDQPLRVYLSCYLVLSSTNDTRAKGILNTAHDMLKTRANGISDPSARQVFLEKVTYNREILSLWQKRHQSDAPSPRQSPDRPS